ncbi:type II secretion system F family protein [Candidatus Desantisbacteria bacterium]|nr:type II secretion system F family protein [Candidatus Desantisbacteria bacterium]
MELKKSKISVEDFILFNRQLASMIKVDLPIPESLEKISATMGKRKITKILEEVTRDIRGGWSFSKAIARQSMYFPPLYLSMIKAGEETGNLSTVLHQLISHFQEIANLRKKVINTLIYPSIIVTISFMVLIFILTFTVPSFVSIFESFGARLPLVTSVVIRIALFTRDNILFIAGAGAFSILMLLIFSKTQAGRFIIDAIKLKIPLVGKLLRNYSIFYFCRTLGDLLAAGVPIIDALELTKGVLENKVVKSAISKIREEVVEGSTVSGPLEKTGVFPATLIWMMKIGEKRGDLDEVLLEVGEFYHQEVISRTDLMTKLVEPVLIMFLGITIGAIVIAMYLPIFMLSTLIGG